MSVDDELYPEPVTCWLCLGDGTIDDDEFISSLIECPECYGERWVAP